MTIEIKQVIVRAVVEPGPARLEHSAAPATTPPSPQPSLDRELLVAECTRRVLRELRRGRGR